MRTTTIFAGVSIALFAACFSAVLTSSGDRGVGDAAVRQGEQDPIRAKPAIDRAKKLPLEAVRAPVAVGAVAFQHAERLVSFGPRYSANALGKPGWTRQLAYLEQEFGAMDLEVERDTWTDRKELITFSNVSVTIRGKRKERIVIACHHDTKCTNGHADKAHNFDFVGANDGASAVGLLLALAPVLQERANEATIELVFFDGEESLDWSWNDAQRALFGSRRYVKRYVDARALGEASRIEAMILLDMVGRKDLHIQDELYSTTRLREILWSAAVACGHQRQFFVRSEAASDDHMPFLEQGIPALDLIDLNGNPTWHTPLDTIENISAASMQKVADVVLTMLPEVERVYLKQ